MRFIKGFKIEQLCFSLLLFTDHSVCEVDSLQLDLMYRTLHAEECTSFKYSWKFHENGSKAIPKS